MTRPHDTLLLHLKARGLPMPINEYKFHDTRRWRFDMCWPEEMLAVECDGGVWSQGRHVRGAGYENDCEKLNVAAELGWRVLRFTTGMIRSGKAIEQLQRILA